MEHYTPLLRLLFTTPYSDIVHCTLHIVHISKLNDLLLGQ